MTTTLPPSTYRSSGSVRDRRASSGAWCRVKGLQHGGPRQAAAALHASNDEAESLIERIKGQARRRPARRCAPRPVRWPAFGRVPPSTGRRQTVPRDRRSRQFSVRWERHDRLRSGKRKKGTVQRGADAGQAGPDRGRVADRLVFRGFTVSRCPPSTAVRRSASGCVARTPGTGCSWKTSGRRLKKLVADSPSDNAMLKEPARPRAPGRPGARGRGTLTRPCPRWWAQHGRPSRSRRTPRPRSKGVWWTLCTAALG